MEKFESLNDEEKGRLLDLFRLNQKIEEVTDYYKEESWLTIKNGKRCCALEFEIGGDKFRVIGISLKDACDKLIAVLDGFLNK